MRAPASGSEGRSCAACVLLALLAGCGRPEVSDTGYAGTWVIGNERIRSQLAIGRQGGRWVSRVGVRSTDGNLEIRCGWDGRCEQIEEGAKTYDLVCATSLDPVSGRLRIERRGTPVAPGRKPFHDADELVVEPGGKVLDAFTIERDGVRFDGDARPRREYRKISDAVADLPAGGER